MKKKYKGLILLLIVLVVVTFMLIQLNVFHVAEKIKEEETIGAISRKAQDSNNEVNQPKTRDLGWELTLVNYGNLLPEDFKIELEDIDQYRQFDARAISYLKKMIEDMRKDGIENIWVQSSYRSMKEQKVIYQRKVETYMEQGKTREEAEELTRKTINRPGESEHNLGLAVDFNYVEKNFDELKGFSWLKEHAQEYGFILRYPKEKEEITKVEYEPWHWRYVGKEHAKEMNEKNMCLEEYVAFKQEES